MSKKPAYPIEEHTNLLIKNISLDYIVHNMDIKEICRKYQITQKVFKIIYKDYNLESKRESFLNKTIDKATDLCGREQAKMLQKITNVLSTHITRIERLQSASKHHMLSHAHIKELTAIFTVLDKTYRLDNDKPTDSTISKVQVDIPTNVPIVSENKFKESIVEAEVTKEVEKPKEEEISVEVDDDIMGGPL